MQRHKAIWDWLARLPELFRGFWGLAGAVILIAPLTANAQMAREYLQTPVKQFAGFIEYSIGQAQSATSADLPLANDLTFSHVTVPYLLYSFPLNKKYAGVDVTTPYVKVRSADGLFETTGFSDPSFAFHMNLFGLPAVTREEIATFVPQNLMSVHFKVNVPIGSYDRNKPVNMGGNRWAFSPLVNLNITRDKGVSWFEVYAAGKFFTDNNEFQGSNKLSQKPILTLTGHYSHNLGKKAWASIGTSYDYGGETSINNVAQNNTANGLRPMVAYSRVLGRFRITVRYENTATKANDHKRNSSVAIRLASLLF
jgi:hypothetical protein